MTRDEMIAAPPSPPLPNRAVSRPMPNLETLHRDVWHAAIRFYVYRTPKKNAAAVKHLRKMLNRYTRAVSKGTR
jgi:hypothetical protein